LGIQCRCTKGVQVQIAFLRPAQTVIDTVLSIESVTRDGIKKVVFVVISTGGITHFITGFIVFFIMVFGVCLLFKFS
jgi:hypothetical protein